MDEQFRRQGDHGWRASIDHQLVTLLSDHKVVHDQLLKLEEELEILDRYIRGDPNNQKDGLETRLRDVEKANHKATMVIFGDATGDRGLLKEFQDLKAGRVDRVALRRDSLIFWAAIITAALSFTGLILTNWGSISKIVVSDTHLVGAGTRPTSSFKKPARRRTVNRSAPSTLESSGPNTDEIGEDVR